MANPLPSNHIVNQPDLAPVIPEPALVNEEEEEFEDEDEADEEEPQEEEEFEGEEEEEENEPELTFPYEEADPLNPPPPASDSETEDVVESEDMVELEGETVPNSVHAVSESSAATFLHKDGDSLLPGLMRRDINSIFGRIASLSRRVCIRETTHALAEKKGKAKDKYYGKLISDLGNEVRFSVEERVTALEDLIRKFGNAKERVKSKKLKRDLEEERLSNTLFRVVFEERPSEAIDVSVEDEETPSSELRGSPRDS
ncbi:hypothetical protein Tco_1190513 [Tanacetum coccineum]